MATLQPAYTEEPAAVTAPGPAEAALRAAAGLWFLVTVIGQWVFLYRIVGQYGAATVSGRFPDWEKHNELFKGYVAGDWIGNLTFASHVTLAAVVTLGGLLQLVPHIRAHAIHVHRWTGRIFLVSAAVVSIGGLYMVWVRHATFGPVNSVGVSLNAALNLLCIAMTWHAVRAGDIARHRRWALRTFMVVSGVFFKRVATGPGWFFEFASYLIPLAILEVYLRAKVSRSAKVKFAMALLLLAVVAYVCFGTLRFGAWVRLNT